MNTSTLIVEVIDTEQNLRQEYVFDRSPIRVGRSPLNDLPLERSFVSHCHGVLRFDSRYCEFVDLGSTNGTYLGDTALTKNVPVPISSHTPLSIGDLELRVRHGTGSRVETRASYAFRASEINIQAQSGGNGHGARGASHSPRKPGLPVDLLSPLYVQYRSAWGTFFEALRQQVGPDTDPEALASALMERFPELAQEAEFRRFLGTDRTQLQSPQARPAEPLTALDRAVGAPVPSDIHNAMIDRMAHVLERFAQAFLELRRGQRQFTAGLDILGGDDNEDPIEAIQDPRTLVSYLLAADAPPGRVDELSRAYADIMLHQVALLNGILAGARELLAELSPEALSLGAPRGPMALVLRLFGKDGRLAALQRRLEDLTEEKTLSAVVLGRKFARAYAAAMGHTSDDAAERCHLQRTGPL